MARKADLDAYKKRLELEQSLHLGKTKELMEAQKQLVDLACIGSVERFKLKQISLVMSSDLGIFKSSKNKLNQIKIILDE